MRPEQTPLIWLWTWHPHNNQRLYCEPWCNERKEGANHREGEAQVSLLLRGQRGHLGSLQMMRRGWGVGVLVILMTKWASEITLYYHHYNLLPEDSSWSAKPRESGSYKEVSTRWSGPEGNGKSFEHTPFQLLWTLWLFHLDLWFLLLAAF